jgi:5-oxoprolinase (ATP-hydrolysing)
VGIGIAGVVRTAVAAGHMRVIGFEMGGTSTDVSHYAGEFERAFETLVAGVRMRAPMMSIHTVAAGGGSILQLDGTRLHGGPESVGANAGPASCRRGGPLAVTDANVRPAASSPTGSRACSAPAPTSGSCSTARRAGSVSTTVRSLRLEIRPSAGSRRRARRRG